MSDPLRSVLAADPVSTGCALCGLPAGRNRPEDGDGSERLAFCCHGCRQVYRILVNQPGGKPADLRASGLYRAGLASGLIAQGNPPPDVRPSTEGDASSTISREPAGEAGQELVLGIEGMWCTACAWVIEEVLKKTPGILDVRVVFLSDYARIRYLPHLVPPREIAGRVSGLGYRCSPLETAGAVPPERRRLLFRFGVSALLTANVMMISLVLYTGFFRELTPEAIRYLSLPLWALATAVLAYGGAPLFRKAVSGLVQGAFPMETLISVGALAAYGYSVVQMARGGLHLYFDTASMLVTLVLLGRTLEAHAKEKATGGLQELARLACRKVRLAGSDREQWVSPEAVQPGDLFSVIPDERIPLDGRVLSGRGWLDESILTGEPKPARKNPGDDVSAGTLLLEGDLTLTATRTDRESALHRMIDAIEKALLSKNRFEALSDRILKGFVPGLMGLAFGAFLFLRMGGSTWEEALLRAVTVLVISCPCALGIASPLAKAAALGTGRRRGILVRDPAELEQASEIDTIVLDKTGTLTRGDFTLLDTVTAGCIEEEALARVAAVERFSDHFLAREIVRRAGRLSASPAAATDFETFEGRGVRAVVDGVDVAVGNRSFMTLRDLFLPDALDGQGRLEEDRGHTVAFFGWEGQPRGFFVFGDSLREGAGEVVKEIQEEGIAVWLVSGDAERTTRAVAETCGINRFIGQALPEAKADLVRRLQAEGRRVAMAGDGLNDAAGLAQADVGIAIETGFNLSREAAGIVLLNPDPRRIIEVLRLSRLTRRTIRQNLFFAFLYNGLAIPLAISGFLNPLFAVLAMLMSSLSVIGNTLRNLRPSRLASGQGNHK